MKRFFLSILIVTLFVTISHAQNGRITQYSSAYFTPEDTAKITCFNQAYSVIENMLEGKDSLNYERAIFITENAYWDNRIKYEDFQAVLDYHTEKIKLISKTVKTDKNNKNKISDNWAIFDYMTDTSWYIKGVQLNKKLPLRYALSDPYGTQNWRNSQVLNLLNPYYGEGNCYAMVSLFKIFSERLKTNAFITIAPYHVYIQHKDFRGDYYNVELPTRTFPGDGTIKTLTYTTHDGVVSGIEMRKLDLKESIALCLIYLAKGYEYKYGEKDAQFVLKCSNLVLKHDSLNLNAMLLKASVMEEAVIKYMKRKNIADITTLKNNKEVKNLFSDYEKWMFKIYKLGYREIPNDMEKMIMAGIRRREEGKPTKDYTPDPFPGLKTQNLRYATLSGGLFDEAHLKTDYITYSRTTLKTETGKITSIVKEDSAKGYKIDPIIFAWNVDPLAKKYPGISPYVAFANNPILFVDEDGKEPHIKRTVDENGNVTIKVTSTLVLISQQKEAIENAHNIHSQLGGYLPNQVLKNADGTTTTVVFETNLVVAKNNSEFLKLNKQLNNATVPIYYEEGARANYDGGGITFGKTTSAGEFAHELGHDFGYADQYLEMNNNSYPIAGNLNSMFGTANAMTPEEAQKLVNAVNTSGQTDAVFSPIDTDKDAPQNGSVVEVHTPNQGGFSSTTRKAKVKSGVPGQKTKSGKFLD